MRALIRALALLAVAGAAGCEDRYIDLLGRGPDGGAADAARDSALGDVSDLADAAFPDGNGLADGGDFPDGGFPDAGPVVDAAFQARQIPETDKDPLACPEITAKAPPVRPGPAPPPSAPSARSQVSCHRTGHRSWDTAAGRLLTASGEGVPGTGPVASRQLRILAALALNRPGPPADISCYRPAP